MCLKIWNVDVLLRFIGLNNKDIEAYCLKFEAS